jgi:hypothetical protein
MKMTNAWNQTICRQRRSKFVTTLFIVRYSPAFYLSTAEFLLL